MLRQKNLCGLKTSTISIEKYEISFLIVCVKLGIFNGELNGLPRQISESFIFSIECDVSAACDKLRSFKSWITCEIL